MDGIISLPICFAGYFLIPDLPENTKTFYLNEKVCIFFLLRTLVGRHGI
jgi:hypothetical protein